MTLTDRPAALTLLQKFICIENLTPEAIPDYATIQTALAVVAEASDYQILGICADNWQQGQLALYSYLTALDYDDRPEIPPVSGSLYIKYNPRLRSCHAEPYDGQHRGVLVACISAYDEGVNETFGHLPLDLFLQNDSQTPPH
ncbi:MAG: DUF1824 family protein [Synechococcales bacterium]|nr:DUF1824 family protein [Synechococcales bacterium]